MKKILLLLTLFLLLGAGCSSNIKDKTPDSSPLLKQEVENEEINTNDKNNLDLSGQGLQKVEQTIFKQTNLTSLNVSNNNLTGSLPAEIRQLTKLQYLNAANNQMTGVPAEIGQLSNLVELNLANNQLTGLPNELGNLKNLKTLNLSGNEVSQQDLDGIRKNLPSSVNIIE